MSPDERYEEKEKEKEAVKLKKMVDGLTAQDRQLIFEQGSCYT